MEVNGIANNAVAQTEENGIKGDDDEGSRVERIRIEDEEKRLARKKAREEFIREMEKCGFVLCRCEYPVTSLEDLCENCRRTYEERPFFPPSPMADPQYFVHLQNNANGFGAAHP